jgi:hypothetical protein
VFEFGQLQPKDSHKEVVTTERKLRAESDKPRTHIIAFSEGRLAKASKRAGRVKGKLRLNDFREGEDHECGGLCDIPDITERDDM